MYNICPTYGWGQRFADAENTSRSPYAAPTEATEKWHVTRDGSGLFRSITTGSGGNVYAAYSANGAGDEQSSLWVINQFGDTVSKIPLGTYNEGVGFTAQDEAGYVYIPTDDGRIFKVNPKTGSSTSIFTEPDSTQLQSVKIDEGGLLYAATAGSTSGDKLYCLNQSGTLQWTYAVHAD